MRKGRLSSSGACSESLLDESSHQAIPCLIVFLAILPWRRRVTRSTARGRRRTFGDEAHDADVADQGAGDPKPS
jgi:hypothetical protein